MVDNVNIDAIYFAGIALILAKSQIYFALISGNKILLWDVIVSSYGIDLRKYLCNNIRIVIFMVEIMETATSNSVRKITAHIPTELLDSAQNFTGLGITETLKKPMLTKNSAPYVVKWTSKAI